MRQSGFELLRIISMLMVVAVHVNFYSLGWPVQADLQAAPSTTFARLLFQSFSAGCVDIFILISGWFGIKPSFKKFAHFVFQPFFFSFGLLFVALLLHKVPMGLPVLKELGLGLFFHDYWFISSYLLLFLLAPALNSFLDNNSRRTALITVICFFLYEFIYGWLFNYREINRGYSTISFIGLYLLAGYLKRHPSPVTRLKPAADACIFVFTCLLNTLVCLFMLGKGHDIMRFYNYTSPLVVLGSVSLLLCFSKLMFYSKFINYVASSALSVYLFHQNHFINGEFTRISIQIFNNNGLPVYFIKIVIYILAVFVISVLIDQIRKAVDFLITKQITSIIKNNG